MFELKPKLKEWSAWMQKIASILLCHRAVYAGLSVCHGSGCILTEKPELYGPMALLYAVLVIKG